MGFLKPFNLLILIALFGLSIFSSNAQSDQGTDYSSIVKQADKYFGSGDYIKAKTSYEYALRLRPDEVYPKNQLDKVLKKLREQMMVMEQYSSVISQADKFFWSGEYDNAKLKYQEASKMVPAEAYPKQKVTEIDEIKAEERKVEVAYDDAIYRAERFEKYRKYDEAIAQYEKALEFSPGDKALQDKIAELQVTKVQYEQAKQDYGQIVASADRLFSLKFYEAARDEYQKASDARPDEDYPKNQLELIRPLLQKRQEFDQLVEKGDEYYMERDFAMSLKSYEDALKIYPEENYPMTMIERIKGSSSDTQALSTTLPVTETAESDNQTENTEDIYILALADADQFFGLQNYEEAKRAYMKASNLRPNEKYPLDKIKEINDLQYTMNSEEAAFNRVIAAGDRMFDAGEYDKAEARYTEALQIKPGNEYPLQKLKDIEKKIVEQELKVQRTFNDIIEEADAMFAKGDLAEARKGYQQALKYKPEEGYPKQQIANIDLQLGDLDNLKTDYMRLIADADQLFTSKEYQKAKAKYIEAAAIFPDEIHPKTRIESINLINRGDFEKSQKEYDKAIADADKFLAAGVYDQSLDSYRRAMALMPDEYYPPQMIDRIMKILNDNAMRKIITTPVVVDNNLQKNFNFDPLGFADRRGSVLLIKARNLSENEFKIILGYGKGGAKKGGITIPILADTDVKEYIVLIGKQYSWSSEDNNFISLTPQGGNIEITLMEISKGE